jgi:hypothetical protein
MAFIAMPRDTRQQMVYRSPNSYEHFSCSYTDEQTKCIALNFPFLSSARAIQINNQFFGNIGLTCLLVA